VSGIISMNLTRKLLGRDGNKASRAYVERLISEGQIGGKQPFGPGSEWLISRADVLGIVPEAEQPPPDE